MGLFKKKIRAEDAPEILSEIIRIIIDASGQSIKDFIKSFLDRLNIPTIQIDIPVQTNLTTSIVQTLMKSINNDRALVALKRIKKLLDQYKI